MSHARTEPGLPVEKPAIPEHPNAEQIRLLRLLRRAGLVEGCTLVLLVCIAVPLKHLAGQPQYVTWLGPLHGMSFLFYGYAAAMATTSGGWRRGEIARVCIAALLPFGAFVNDLFLSRKLAALRAADEVLR